MRSRNDCQERRRLAANVEGEITAKRKEELCKEIMKIGGLWTIKEHISSKLRGINAKQQHKALKLQINFYCFK